MQLAAMVHPKVVNSAYFSPISGRKILTTCIDNRIRLSPSNTCDHHILDALRSSFILNLMTCAVMYASPMQGHAAYLLHFHIIWPGFRGHRVCISDEVRGYVTGRLLKGCCTA